MGQLALVPGKYHIYVLRSFALKLYPAPVPPSARTRLFGQGRAGVWGYGTVLVQHLSQPFTLAFFSELLLSEDAAYNLSKPSQKPPTLLRALPPLSPGVTRSPQLLLRGRRHLGPMVCTMVFARMGLKHV